MQSGFYVAVSGQLAIERRLQSIANNVANMNTAGYRADGVTFATVLSQAGDTPVAFSTQGTTFISRHSGDITKTGNPLDVAVQGDAWLAIRTKAGIAYTRDGRMTMTSTGELRSVDGNAVLDAGGTPLLLDPEGGAPTIAADGMITQGGRQVGALGLFSIDPGANLVRAENASVVPDQPPTPVLDFTNNGVVQGFVENSNVNPVLELSKLITIQHALDGMTQANQTAESSMGDAIKTLGGGS